MHKKISTVGIRPAILLMAGVVIFGSCNIINQSSVHGFNNGYFRQNAGVKKTWVYANITPDSINLHACYNDSVAANAYLSVALTPGSRMAEPKLKLTKRSTDIDITSVLFKYRPSAGGLPQQLTSDLNMAIYIGQRYDFFTLTNTTNALKKSAVNIQNWGYDFGVFAGPGVTAVNQFTTQNNILLEYSAPILQTGVAAFIETGIASFGISVGMDYLLNNQRNIWIYQQKPWLGFMVGIAFN